MDPGCQLMSDDFAGRTCHNANLSIKAILGMASYGEMAGMLGKEKLSKAYISKARSWAQEWVQKDKAGNHYKLTFDDPPSSWSMKYNLVWDNVFGWHIFPSSVSRNAISFYLTKLNKYGLPFDSRHTYTKSDWTNFTAAMAEKNQHLKNLSGRCLRHTARLRTGCQ